jgi:dihydroxy-acid dehydratase
MGNTVVWKPASSLVYTPYLIMEILEEAGLPPGVINFVPGSGATVGNICLVDPDLAGVHFTGSTRVFHQMWRTVGENIAAAENFNPDVIKPYAEPFKEKAGIAILRGNIAPRGAVIKPSAATPALMQHTGRAVVFEDSDDFHRRIDDESLDVDETCILVLKNCGPKGYPGMAEVGNMPLPPKVLRKGITDMVRISDARMSGTAYGTVVLHTAPEAAAGGPLALVQSGDLITLDVAGRSLHLHVDDAELERRRAAWTPPTPPLDSGYWKLYIDHVLQADEGADLDFLRGRRGAFVPKDNH